MPHFLKAASVVSLLLWGSTTLPSITVPLLTHALVVHLLNELVHRFLGINSLWLLVALTLATSLLAAGLLTRILRVSR